MKLKTIAIIFFFLLAGCCGAYIYLHYGLGLVLAVGGLIMCSQTTDALKKP